MQPDERESDSEIAKRGLEFLEWLSLRPETEIAVVRPQPAKCLATLSSTHQAPSQCCCSVVAAIAVSRVVHEASGCVAGESFWISQMYARQLCSHWIQQRAERSQALLRWVLL